MGVIRRLKQQYMQNMTIFFFLFSSVSLLKKKVILFISGGEIMSKLLDYTFSIAINLIKSVAGYSANSLSMIGMYEPECPEELIK